MSNALKDYNIRVLWSEEDDTWFFTVNELLGCISHGDSPWEALKEGSVAMKLYLECARKHNDKESISVLKKNGLVRG